MNEPITSQQGQEIVVQAETVDGKPPEKIETIHVCTACESISDHFRCRCPKCGTYNALEERDRKYVVMKPMTHAVPVWTAPDHPGIVRPPGPVGPPGAPVASAPLLTLGDLEMMSGSGRLKTGEESLDFVLGGGLMRPSVILIGGDPGVGKSTLLTQVFGHLGCQYKCYYSAGEEAPLAIGMRVQRVAAFNDQNRANCHLRRGSSFTQVMRDLEAIKPSIVFFDSLQAHLHDRIDPTGDRHKRGSAAQIVPMTKELHTWAHNNDAIVFIVCHVTKSGDFAGVNTVDHDVDMNLMLIRMDDGRVAATSEKNRFGPTDVVGLFEMRENGLKSV